MSKTLATLIEDVRGVFLNGVSSDTSELCKEFGGRMAKMLEARLKEYGKTRPKSLRLSSIGKSELQLWHEIKGGFVGEPLSADTLLKFLYGDIIEEVLLTITEAAGHTVERRQETVELDGIVGHIDAVIDGELVDVKSASSYSFEKFENGTMKDDDAFGYVYQMGAYATALGKKRGYFFAMDKTLGHICLLEQNEWPDVHKRISYLKACMSSDAPPEYRCSIRTDKTGQMYLGVPCSYCPTKNACCKGKIETVFTPSGKPKFLISKDTTDK